MLRAVAAAGIAIGAGSLAIPRPGLRALGLEADGRGVALMARLFGCRDLVLCAALLRASGRGPAARPWADALALMQVGDIAVATALHRSGGLSRRALAVVLGSATPTLAALLAARRQLGSS